MADSNAEHCPPEGPTSLPAYYLTNLSYFTIYFTQGIEILEFYTKVPFYHVLFETALVLWILWLLLSKSYRFRELSLELSEKEEEELIDEWQPDPLVPVSPTYPEDILAPRVVEGKAGHTVHVNGRQCLNLATFNFLGLVGNKRVEDSAISTLHKYGVGSCGPRGFYGTIDVHLHLEERLAKFMQTEEAILYSYGFSTVASAIPAYSKRGDVIFCDKGVCFAIQQGILASRSRVMWFEHNNMDDLERLLKEQQEKDRKNPKKASVTRRFLVAEGLYINHGTVTPLPKLIELKKKYKVRLFLDESCSFGVLGKTGKGVTEYYDVQIDDVDLISVSMENSLATIGGFCCGTSFIVDHQRLSGAGYCFSASLPPMLATAAIEALDIIEEKEGLFDELQRISRMFHKELIGLKGLRVDGDRDSPIIHLRLREPCDTIEEEERKLKQIIEMVFEKNVALTIARYIKTEEKFPVRPSIRVTLNVELTEEEMQDATNIIKEAAGKVFA